MCLGIPVKDAHINIGRSLVGVPIGSRRAEDAVDDGGGIVEE